MSLTLVLILILLFFLLLNSMPVGFALLVSGSAGLLAIAGLQTTLGVLKSSPYEQAASFSLSTIPMFILMAEFLTAGRVTRELFSACHMWLGRLRGGLSFASVSAGVLLAAISGSSSASAGTLAAAAYPEMKRYGYDKAFATGVVATVGTLAMVFSVFLTLTGSTQDLISAIQTSGMSRWWIFLAFLLMYLILCFFLDQLAILILTLPLVFPITMSLEFNPVWLGIVFVKTAEIGLVSPPLGLNVFIVGSVTNVPVSTVFRGIMPFLIADFAVLALIIIFPNLALYIAELASAVK